MTRTCVQVQSKCARGIRHIHAVGVFTPEERPLLVVASNDLTGVVLGGRFLLPGGTVTVHLMTRWGAGQYVVADFLGVRHGLAAPGEVLQHKSYLRQVCTVLYHRFAVLITISAYMWVDCSSLVLFVWRSILVQCNWDRLVP